MGLARACTVSHGPGGRGDSDASQAQVLPGAKRWLNDIEMLDAVAKAYALLGGSAEPGALAQASSGLTAQREDVEVQDTVAKDYALLTSAAESGALAEVFHCDIE